MYAAAKLCSKVVIAIGQLECLVVRTSPKIGIGCTSIVFPSGQRLCDALYDGMDWYFSMPIIVCVSDLVLASCR